MQLTTLGKTGLRVSVAGLGCGGNSRLGLGHGRSEAQCVPIVHKALELGINFFDTAEAYGTEAIVGRGISGVARDSIVLSSKTRITRDGERLTAADIAANLEASLERLGTDYIDVYHLHGVPPHHYPYCRDVLAPALGELKTAGKLRHIGITETASRDVRHDTLRRAARDPIWEVMMFAFHMLNQNAREALLPATRDQGIGTLLMFVVRNIFSRPDYLKNAVGRLIGEGKLDGGAVDAGDPLGFLLHEGGARSLTDAAYRFARHEPGADVVLTGTGSPDHLESNVSSILASPLPAGDVERLYGLFGALEGIGLDAPDHMKSGPMKSDQR